MKILCDVCCKDEALIFCCADEAALCDACDWRVHRANKLACKHRRFSLSAPSALTHPICDICQEKRGFLFCQEDRATLCKDCDASVHSANHLTMKHNRFLLTGVRLSTTPISASPVPEPEEAVAKANTKTTTSSGNRNKDLVAESSFPIASTTTSGAASTATSSISEYLTKMCPGWCVEDLLVDDATAAMENFAKGGELLPFVEPALVASGLESPEEKFPIWAAHVPQFPPSGIPAAAAAVGCYHPWHASKEAGLCYQQEPKVGRDRWSEDAFMVPQISTASTPTNSKRQKHSLWYYGDPTWFFCSDQ